MKAKMRIRVLRRLAIAGSLSALAVPAAAVAYPTDGVPHIPVRAENAGAVPYQLPSNFHPEVQTSKREFTLPSGFHSEVQTQSRPIAQRQFTLPAGFRPEVQNPGSPASASQPSSITREIRTVTEDGNPTLALVLAAIALAVALCGTAYAWVRMTRIERGSRPLAS
jgi:hypothetical protein